MDKDEDDEILDALTESVGRGCLEAFILFVTFLLLMLLFASCRSVKYVTVPDVHTDTVLITKQQRDSIWLHDSVYVHEWSKNDTVYVELSKWHTKYIERLRTDTLYEHRVDSVGVPYPVEVKVEKELNWWQKFRMKVGGFALVLFAGFVFWKLFKLWRYFHPM